MEMQPALRRPLVAQICVAQAVRLVVRLQQVLDNGAGLPQRKAGVGVLNGRDAAVGVHGLEGLLVEDGEVHDLRGVGDRELVEDDGDLPWVGALLFR